MRHEEAFRHLPDLLDDRDDVRLLAHVRGCAECQRRLFLLGRVDRMLRDGASVGQTEQHRWHASWRLVAATAVVAGAIAATLVLALSHAGHTHALVLKTATGRSVARAVMGHADARNASLALTARGMPVDAGRLYVLWAGANGSSMQVGRFMVDRSGSCRASFNLPADHAWSRLWVTKMGRPSDIIATT